MTSCVIDNLATFCTLTSRRDLDLWSFDLECLQYIECYMLKSYTKFERNRTIPCWVTDDLAKCVQGGLPNSMGRFDQTAPNPSPLNQTRNFGTGYSFVSKWGRLKEEWCPRSRPIFTVFDPCKLSGGMGRMLSGRIEYTLRRNLSYTFDRRQLLGVEV